MIIKIFNSKNLSFLMLLLLCNCGVTVDPNEDFVKKYGNQVKKINLARQHSDEKESKKNVVVSSDYSYSSDVIGQEESEHLNPDFEIKYSSNYSTFRKIGVEFDAIDIPENDAYGISTNLDMKKEYLLVGNNYLQKNIDDITNSYKFRENIEVSKSLIAQKKAAKTKLIKKQKITTKPNQEPKPDQSSTKMNTSSETGGKVSSKFNAIIDSVKNVSKKLQ